MDQPEPATKDPELSPNRGVAKWKLKLLAILVSCACAIILSEGALRWFFIELVSFGEDERSLLYQYDSRLGWFPMRNHTNQFTASRTITAVNNSEGFRDREWRRNENPRIAVIGDSFVWGYDVEASERFTDRLQAKHPEWAVYNLGVSGYGTDQELLLLQQWFDECRPALVLLVFCSDTDHEDNSTNVQNGEYYKPYFTVADDFSIELNGVPVPKSARAFCADHKFLCQAYLVRLLARAYCRLKGASSVEVPDPTPELILAMERFVEQKGAIFAVGVEGPHPPMIRFLQTCHIPCVDLTLGHGPPFRYPSFGAHWTPAGHAVVADTLEPTLVKLLHMGKSRPPPPSLTQRETLEALAQFHFMVGSFRAGQLKTKQAIANYRMALKWSPDFPECLASLAWELATGPDPTQRNGAEAVQMAEKACKMTAGKDPTTLGALAAAYAESGRFALAVTTGEEAIRVANAKGDQSFTTKCKPYLELYRAGKPYHQR
jgi:hypothetical protein